MHSLPQICANIKKSNSTNLKLDKLPTLKPVAFAAIVFSTVAITSCLITFPLILHYIQTLESNVQLDLDFCKSRSRDMWKEMFEIRTNGKQEEAMYLANIVMNRRQLKKRDTMADFWNKRLNDMQLHDDPVESYSSSSSKSNSIVYEGGYSSSKTNALKSSYISSSNKQSTSSYNENESNNKDQFIETPSTGCCTCHRGLPGPPGSRGRDGINGLDGEPGQIGPQGPPAPPGPDSASLFPPQCPCEAEVGEVGPKGPPGADGAVGPPGESGQDGKPGDQGPRGPIGLPGPQGQHGRPGPPGEPGSYTIEIGPPGRPGALGRSGPSGAIGPPGAPGKDGNPGRPGPIGAIGSPGASGKNGALGLNGRPGERGAPGLCDHCPPARLAPGY